MYQLRREPPPVRRMQRKQRGVVLFFALIALLAMSLAAVALVRSVDTNTLIAGNLAFKQSATAGADSGVEQGLNWLFAQNIHGNVLVNINHPLNKTDLVNNPGYHSDSSLDLFADSTWNTANNIKLIATDPATGNSIRYLVQRMCRSPNALPASVENNVKVPPETTCLFLTVAETPEERNTRGYSDTCDPSPLAPCGDSKTQVPVYRLTARVDGVKGTVSYVQAFAF